MRNNYQKAMQQIRQCDDNMGGGLRVGRARGKAKNGGPLVSQSKYPWLFPDFQVRYYV